MNKSILAVALIAAIGAGNAHAAKPKAAKKAVAAATAEQAAPAITVKEAEDSLSRSLARIYGASINKMYAERKQGASKDKFLEGFQIVTKADTSNTDFLDGIAFGLELLRQQIQMKSKQKINLNKDAFAAQLASTLTDTTVLTEGQLRLLNNDVTKLLSATEQLARENDPQAIANKKAGADFVAKTLASDKSYKKTASGLVYKVITAGKGDNYKATDVVKIKYKGTHIDGSTFDENKEGAEMGISNFVAGFKEALQLMRPGCKLRAIIPGDLAYGVRGGGQGVIGPNETLIFDIETPEAAKKPDAEKKPDGPKGPEGPAPGHEPAPGHGPGPGHAPAPDHAPGK